MRVVVTGAAGFIGSHTCEALIALGHSVTGFDCFDDYLYPAQVKRRTAAELERELPRDRFTLVEGNICESADLRKAIGADTDVVLHLAALAGVRPSLREPARYARVNVEGTTNVLEVMRAVGCKRLCFASSSSVYGSKGEGKDLKDVAAFREDDPCLTPASPYAASKRCGELITSSYRDLFGIGISSLRFFTVYGPRQRPDMAIHKFAKAIANGEPIQKFGNGESRRDYTFISDIVAGTVASVERCEPGSYNIYNLGGTSTISLNELISTIEDVVGKKAIIEELPMQPGDVPITYADITNAARDLSYEPRTAPREGIESFWKWYRP